jgi:hypothetical protein
MPRRDPKKATSSISRSSKSRSKNRSSTFADRKPNFPITRTDFETHIAVRLKSEGQSNSMRLKRDSVSNATTRTSAKLIADFSSDVTDRGRQSAVPEAAIFDNLQTRI